MRAKHDFIRFNIVGDRIFADCKLSIVPNDIRPDLPEGWTVRDAQGGLIVERKA